MFGLHGSGPSGHTSGTLRHTPPWQASVVHGSPSVQGAPSCSLGTHSPVVISQIATRQPPFCWMLGQKTPPHCPSVHTSFFVQRSLSSHATPSSSTVATQPSPGLQMFGLHGSGPSGHTSGTLRHTPPLQTSVVHGSPSVQEAPSCSLGTHSPLVVSQMATRQLPFCLMPGQKTPAHLPPVHTSFFVQRSLSSQASPSPIGSSSHTPLSGLHSTGLHASPSDGQSTATPVHWPSKHESPVVQRSPSSQAPPVTGLEKHAPVVLSQTAWLQGSLVSSPGQKTPLHLPPVQRSFFVQRSSSSQGAPSASVTSSHCPVDG